MKGIFLSCLSILLYDVYSCQSDSRLPNKVPTLMIPILLHTFSRSLMTQKDSQVKSHGSASRLIESGSDKRKIIIMIMIWKVQSAITNKRNTPNRNTWEGSKDLYRSLPPEGIQAALASVLGGFWCRPLHKIMSHINICGLLLRYLWVY